MPEPKLDLLQGTLDLMVLQTLAAMGALHGYGIARRIEQVSGEEILLNQGTIYASLVRLQERGWISAQWGTSDNNRKAKFYSITKKGRERLAVDAVYWERLAECDEPGARPGGRRQEMIAWLRQFGHRLRSSFANAYVDAESLKPRWQLISSLRSKKT